MICVPVGEEHHIGCDVLETYEVREDMDTQEFKKITNEYNYTNGRNRETYETTYLDSS